MHYTNECTAKEALLGCLAVNKAQDCVFCSQGLPVGIAWKKRSSFGNILFGLKIPLHYWIDLFFHQKQIFGNALEAISKALLCIDPNQGGLHEIDR